METLRTTIVLENYISEAKRLALEQDTTLKEIIEQALRSYLSGEISRGRQGSGGGRFRVYAGKSRGGLSRETSIEIY